MVSFYKEYSTAFIFPGFRHLLVEFAKRLSLISAQAGQFYFLFLIISALELSNRMARTLHYQ